MEGEAGWRPTSATARTSTRAKRANGSNSIGSVLDVRRRRSCSASCSRRWSSAAHGPRTRPAVRHQHRLRQHHPALPAGRHRPATRISSGGSAASPAGTPWPSWCAPTKTTNVGGHIASFASAATLYDVGFNHFWHAPSEDHGGDLVFIQGHCAPGIYARAYLEGRSQREAARQVPPGDRAAMACPPTRTPG